MPCLLLLLIPVLDVFLFAGYCRLRRIENGIETGGLLAAVYVVMWFLLPVGLRDGLIREDVAWVLGLVFQDSTAANVSVSPILSFLFRFPLFALLTFYPVKRLTSRSLPQTLWLCVLFYVPLGLIPLAEALAQP